MLALIKNLTIALVIVSAATAIILTNDSTGPEIDPRLKDYISDWQKELDLAQIEYEPGFNRLTEIRMIRLPSSKAGYYREWSRSIVISTSQAELGPWSIRATLYHELGHAVFGLSHLNGSIMATHSFTEKEIISNWDQWLAEYLDYCKTNKVKIN